MAGSSSTMLGLFKMVSLRTCLSNRTDFERLSHKTDKRRDFGILAGFING